MTLLFFDIGGGEIVVLVLAALIAFGPKQAGAIARKAGKALSDLNKAAASVKEEIMKEEEEVKKIVAQPTKEIANRANEIGMIDADYEIAEQKKQQDLERDKKETEQATTL